MNTQKSLHFFEPENTNNTESTRTGTSNFKIN